METLAQCSVYRHLKCKDFYVCSVMDMSEWLTVAGCLIAETVCGPIIRRVLLVGQWNMMTVMLIVLAHSLLPLLNHMIMVLSYSDHIHADHIET